MNQIMSFSKEGIDVLGTAADDPNNVNFSSEYNTLKYHQTGSIALTPSGTTVHGTVSHSLGYNPFFMVYTDAGAGTTGFWYLCPFEFQDSPPPVNSFFTADVDNNNMYIHAYTDTATGTINFKYFIFRNNLGL